MRAARIALLLGLVGVSPAADAISGSLCTDHDLDPVPAWAAGRDADGCLLVDPGTGAAPVPFQFERMDLHTIAPAIDIPGGRCSTTPAHLCTMVIWNSILDNYLSPSRRNEDVLHFGGRSFEYFLVKGSIIANTYHCEGREWVGPNGISCTTVNSGLHTDAHQVRCNGGNGGWHVYQDSRILNAEHLIFISGNECDPFFGPPQSYLFQGLEFGNVNTPVGAATNWIDDCYARGGGATNCDSDKRFLIGSADLPGRKHPEIWIVDAWGPNALFELRESVADKLIVVNTGCSSNGCGGTVGYENGWVHPLGFGALEPGPGVCPNGLITQEPARLTTSGMATFCYTSLENALADTPTATAHQGDCPAAHCPHQAPPFLQLSPRGWATPPGNPVP